MPDRAVVDNWIFNVRVISEGATEQEAKDLVYLTVKHPLANQEGVALMGVAQEIPQPRALVALSDDRQWLVKADHPEVISSPSFSIYEAMKDGSLRTVKWVPETGQDAQEVLAAWEGGRG